MKVLKWGIGFVLVRAVLVAMLLAEVREHPEAVFLVLFDIPTLAACFVLGVVGLGCSIRDAADVGFHGLGFVVWFGLGVLGAYVVEAVRRVWRRQGDRSA